LASISASLSLMPPYQDISFTLPSVSVKIA
jgi:hypothetical protein